MINPYSEEIQLQHFKKAVLPYEFEINRATMVSQAHQLWHDVADIVADHCPDNFAQASFTMHPDFSDQGHFPDQLLQHFGLFCLGTRAVKVEPRSSFISSNPDKGKISIAIITLAKRQIYQALASKVNEIKAGTLLGYQLNALESIDAVTSYDRLLLPDNYQSSVYLAGIYIRPGETAEETRKQFTDYANQNKFQVNPDFFVQKGGIFYLLIKGNKGDMTAISEHPLVATIQEPTKAKK